MFSQELSIVFLLCCYVCLSYVFDRVYVFLLFDLY